MKLETEIAIALDWTSHHEQYHKVNGKADHSIADCAPVVSWVTLGYLMETLKVEFVRNIVHSNSEWTAESPRRKGMFMDMERRTLKRWLA